MLYKVDKRVHGQQHTYGPGVTLAPCSSTLLRWRSLGFNPRAAVLGGPTLVRGHGQYRNTPDLSIASAQVREVYGTPAMQSCLD